MLPKKYWVTRREAYDIRRGGERNNIVNVGHAEREMGMCFAGKRALACEELIPFSEELLRRTKNTHTLVLDFGRSILEMRGLQPERFQPNQYGHFTWSCDEPYLQGRELPTWRLIRNEPLFTAKKVNWRHNLKSQLQLISQYRYVPSARQLVNFLLLAGPYDECWKAYCHRSIRTASDGFTIGINTTTETRWNREGNEYEDDIISISRVHPIADVDDGIASAYKPLPSPQP
jgi:hypothetical protein